MQHQPCLLHLGLHLLFTYQLRQPHFTKLRVSSQEYVDLTQQNSNVFPLIVVEGSLLYLFINYLLIICIGLLFRWFVMEMRVVIACLLLGVDLICKKVRRLEIAGVFGASWWRGMFQQVQWVIYVLFFVLICMLVRKLFGVILE